MQVFWMQLKDCLNENGIEIDITFKTTTFGILELHANENRFNYFMILQAKYFIFINKCKKVIVKLASFQILHEKQMNIERSHL